MDESGPGIGVDIELDGMVAGVDKLDETYDGALMLEEGARVFEVEVLGLEGLENGVIVDERTVVLPLLGALEVDPLPGGFVGTEPMLWSSPLSQSPSVSLMLLGWPLSLLVELGAGGIETVPGLGIPDDHVPGVHVAGVGVETRGLGIDEGLGEPLQES